MPLRYRNLSVSYLSIGQRAYVTDLGEVRVTRKAGSRRWPCWFVVMVTSLAYVGVVPGPASAEGRTERSSITITSNDGFNPANGVRSGSGTADDPFVISGWKVSSIRISDTDAYVVIRDNEISRLTLNWNGDRLTVVNNVIGDMRVNENVRRTGGPTSGRIANNTFRSVSQIRHFDGIFENNVVGKQGSTNLPFFGRPIVAFDGFNGARFRNNTLYGYLRVQLHGHHHSSSFSDHSHNHSAAGAQGEMGSVDHTKRYHTVSITGNTIHGNGNSALVYTDQVHAANDRTASSEQNQDLNKPHTHFTKVKLSNNKLVNGALRVDVFNSPDKLHPDKGSGLVDIKHNTISVARDLDDVFDEIHGINVRRARGLMLHIVGNAVTVTLDEGDPVTTRWARDAGIFLEDLDAADVMLTDNRVADAPFGIYASFFSESVHWSISDLKTSEVEQPVYWDESVKNPPERDGKSGEQSGHSHGDH